jgi:outer membrane protein TolC
MKRWKQGLAWLALAASGLTGCKQQLFIHEKDYEHYRNLGLQAGAPPNLDTDPTVTLHPASYNWPKPATVEDIDRPKWFMSLAEALALGLERGNTGSQSLLNPGIPNENLIFGGAGGIQTDSIRVLALQPALSGTDIEASLAKFDARWLSSMTWGKTDNATQNVLTSIQNGDTANFSTGIYKALPTGGTTGITFSTDYNKIGPQSAAAFQAVNPSYRPRIQMQFEQPLLQNYGIEINQLNVNHPGSTQVPRFRPAGGGRVEGILVTRLRYDQSKAEFERNVNFLLLNVEYAYWNLYAAYGQLWARDVAIAEALVLWDTVKTRTLAGIDIPGGTERTRAQLEAFRAQRISALGQVLESERQLRSLLGLGEDGRVIVPVDAPTLAGYTPDWQSAMNDALNNRPELTLARQDLKFRQFDIMIQKNLLKPDLRFLANYDVNGIGRRLDGSTFFPGVVDQQGQPAPQNAFGDLALNRWNSWQFGFLLDVPLGFRDAHAAVRSARLRLYESYYTLRDSERKVLLQLDVQYRRLSEFRGVAQAQSEQARQAAAQNVILNSRLEIETNKAVALEGILNAQRTFSDAAVAKFRAISDYNNTLAAFQFAKGTILPYDNVVINEGQLPEAAQIRAVDHIRERLDGLKLRERAAIENGPAGAYPIETGQPIPADVLAPAQDAIPNVPAMLQSSQRAESAASRIKSVPTNELPSWGGSPYGKSPVVPATATTPVPAPPK